MVAFTCSRPLAFSIHFLRPISVAQEKPDIPSSLSLFLALFLGSRLSRSLTASFSLRPMFIRGRYAIPKIYGRFGNVCSRPRARNHFPGGLCTEFHDVSRDTNEPISSLRSRKCWTFHWKQYFLMNALSVWAWSVSTVSMTSDLIWIHVWILRIHWRSVLNFVQNINVEFLEFSIFRMI